MRRASASALPARIIILRRDAAPVRALAADQRVLDADHRQPGLGQPAGRLLATHAEADDHDVHPLRFTHGTA